MQMDRGRKNVEKMDKDTRLHSDSWKTSVIYRLKAKRQTTY